MQTKTTNKYALDLDKKNFCCNLSEKELINWMQVARSTGIGNVTFHSLISVYKTPAKILEKIPDLVCNTKKAIKVPSVLQIEKEIELTKKIGGQIIASCSPEYSKVLSCIKDPPPVITIIGNKALLNKTSVAIVGARSATLNSCIFAKKIALEIAKCDVNIVSGLALGIDSVVHDIVDYNLNTSAVIATGIDNIYPKENTALRDKIAKGGLLLTELELGAKPSPMTFTRRNRIISGLSECTILIEAGTKSGSLSTASYANNQNKVVFAAPGAPFDKRFAGSNAAIKNGAHLLDCAEDVIDFLKQKTGKLNYDTRQMQDWDLDLKDDAKYQNTQIKNAKKELLQKIDYYPIGINLLVQNLQIPKSLALVAIIELEIEDRVVRYHDGTISLKYKFGSDLPLKSFAKLK